MKTTRTISMPTAAVSASVRLALSLIAFGAIAGCVPMQGEGPRPSELDRMVAATKQAPPAPTPAAAPVASAPGTEAAPAPPAPPATPPPLPPILPFDEAITTAARNVFKAALAQDPNAKFVVIDPLIDGVTGYQSKATRTIQDVIIKVARQDFPQYLVKSITPEILEQKPRILVGTFTPVNAQNKPAGEREAFRFCLVMGDLKTGKVIAKSVVRTPIAQADSTPTSTFGDSPVWSEDASVQAYIATCQGSKVGDPIKAEYVGGLFAAALINEASQAYDEGRYSEALDLYRTAHKADAGDQLRVYNGIYLSLMKLGKMDQAQVAFKDLVDYGLRNKRLAVKFTFRPGSVRFANDPKTTNTYDMWLHEIASEASDKRVCLHITGHTSPTGPAALNQELSLERAEYVQTKLEGDAPYLQKRTTAEGRGSRDNIIGTGRDDASDAIDRRVELNPIEPCT
ncbi:MAG TPA: OmpA family protein [Steroidobacteraceae bacterium]|jgi:outer membrane protein OmpA-like peptidoglycan-associated protein|nr:OmpA family protein [Steroidobacteraceae bacterium]